jgi:integrase
MPRPRTGSLEPAGKHADGRPRFRLRLRLADGSKSDRFDVPEGMSEKQARAWVAGMQADEDAQGGLYAEKLLKKQRAGTQTPVARAAADEMDRWFDTWEAARKSKGLTATADNRSHYYGHILSDFDGKHVREWTPDDVRSHVRALDAKVRAGTLAWKSALNIWGTTRKICADAISSKLDALRVRTDDPTANVEGPDRGDEKAKPFLYPSEFLRFVSCEAVPLRWRLAVTLSVFLFPRYGELRVLEWQDGDIDLEHGTIHIHRAWDRRQRVVKPTKTGRSRRFSIEPALLPLLRELFNRAGGTGPILDMASEYEMAVGLRRWLTKAGVARSELHVGTPTTKKLSWHDLRATGLTWMAVRGDDPLKIMQRAGHTNFQTTQIYVRTAEAIREGFGDVFPNLPAALFGPNERTKRVQVAEVLVGQPGLENVEHACIDHASSGCGERASVKDADEARKGVDAEGFGPTFGPSDPVEAALAKALEAATSAGRFDVVAQLARELEARRLGRVTNVVRLERRGRAHQG